MTFDITAEYKSTAEPTIQVERSKLLGVLPWLGKTFSISFDMVIPDLSKNTAIWTNVLHLSSDGNCCKSGERIPGIWLHNGKKVTAAMDISGNGNKYFFGEGDKEWLKQGTSKIKISQKQVDGKVGIRNCLRGGY